MPDDTPMTLVTGATGDIGDPLTRSLHEAGVSFRVLCRRRQQVEQFAARGV